jgi:hypothetical protein
MHALFPDWYRVANPTPDSATVESRWAATNEFLQSVTKAEIAQLAAFVCHDSAVLLRFKDLHKQHDALMPTRHVDEELRILAAAALRVAIETIKGGRGDVAALALLCGSFGESDQPSWLGEHVEAAASHVAGRGQAVRGLAQPPIPDPYDAVAMKAAFDAVTSSLSTVAEANDYLWWAFTKFSAKLGTPYSGMSPMLAALAGAQDLFRFVRHVPAAQETETLLLHVVGEVGGTSASALSLKNVMSALTREQAEKLGRTIPSECGSLCPLHWCISKVAERSSWIAAFEKDFGIKTATTFAPQVIALQALRELSLCASFAESRK